jgi:Ca2+-binding EF-hand superfamily protein
MKTAFDKIDTDGSGKLDVKELREYFLSTTDQPVIEVNRKSLVKLKS